MFPAIRRRRGAVIAGIAVCVVAVGVGVAAAHYIRLERYVWEDGNGKCLKNRSEISDGNTSGGAIKGYSKVNAFAQKELGPGTFQDDCAVGWERDLRVRAILQKQSSTGSFYDCVRSNGTRADTGWSYRYSTEHQITKYWNADCGSGYYRTRGCTQLKINNAWQPTTDSGCIHTGKHWLRP
jgi:hypothetical protein